MLTILKSGWGPWRN